MPLPTSDVLDLCDARSETAAVCATVFHQYGRRRLIAGLIRTVRCFEDNSLVKAAAGQRSDGEVLVVDGGGSLRTALMGDMIATAAERNGWAGVVIHGAVRDSAALDTMDFHVKCLGATPRRSSKAGAGERDVRLQFGGIAFPPGAFLYSDDDGVVVVSAELAEPTNQLAAPGGAAAA